VTLGTTTFENNGAGSVVELLLLLLLMGLVVRRITKEGQRLTAVVERDAPEGVGVVGQLVDVLKRG
jgi:hypothetical protein